MVTTPASVEANLAANLYADISTLIGTPIGVFPAYSTVSAVLAQGCTIDKNNNKVIVAVKNITNAKVDSVQYYVYVVVLPEDYITL